MRKDLFWGTPEAKAILRGHLGDVRALAQQCGLLNPVAARVWKWCGIDAEPPRFRGEPDRTARLDAA